MSGSSMERDPDCPLAGPVDQTSLLIYTSFTAARIASVVPEDGIYDNTLDIKRRLEIQY